MNQRDSFLDYLELTKPRITSLVLITTFVGYVLAAHGVWNILHLVHTLLGTFLVAGGSCALNQFLERVADGKMKRTENRPLPSHRMKENHALGFGVLLCVAGLLHIAIFVNLLTSLLAAVTLITYLFVYTPLKPKTPLCTLIGAIPGALPPMMGWTAARNEIQMGAWLLFFILFLWQLPHFLSLAVIYREDYSRGGFPMLSVLDGDGTMTSRQIFLYTTALLMVSLIPSLKGLAGPVYFLGALVMGLIFLSFATRCLLSLARKKDSLFYYRTVFHASIIYLPILLFLLVIDKR